MPPVKGARPQKFDKFAQATSSSSSSKGRGGFSSIRSKPDFEQRFGKTKFKFQPDATMPVSAQIFSMEELYPWLEELSEQLAVAETTCMPGNEYVLYPKLFIVLKCLCGLVSSPFAPPRVSMDASADLVEMGDEEDEEEEEEEEKKSEEESPSSSRSGTPPTIHNVRIALEQQLKVNQLTVKGSAEFVVHFAQEDQEDQRDEEGQVSAGNSLFVPKLVVEAKTSIDNNNGLYQLCAEMAILQESNGVDDKGAYLPVHGALTDYQNWIFVSLSSKRVFSHTINLTVIKKLTRVDNISTGYMVVKPSIVQLVNWFLNIAEGSAAASVSMDRRMQSMMEAKTQLGGNALCEIRKQIEIEREAREQAKREKEEAERKAEEAAELARREAERKAEEAAELARRDAEQNMIQVLRKKNEDKNEAFDLFSQVFPTESRAEFERLWNE